ncbi:MAG: hypothetical protein H7210_06505, partial [Pyrinomonadaceae bacterium]|nr:hypothetical protein [Phycisphaerales bacterium]
AKATAKSQHVFLNGRPIRDKTIQHALREAYRGLIEPGRYPTAVIMLEMDPGAVDVNVHPAKTEVRFRDSSLVHGVVLRAVRDALRSADLTPGTPTPRRDTGETGGVQPAGGQFQRGFRDGSSPSGGSSHTSPVPRTIDPTGFVEYFKRPIQGAGGQRLSYDAIREVVETTLPGHVAPNGFASDDASPARNDIDDDAISRATDQQLQHTPGRDARSALGTGASADAHDAASLPMPRAEGRILQIHNSYVVTQDDQGMLIIDQHALHERVMFEQLLARVRSGDLESQRMLVPTVVPAPARLIDRLREIAGLCAKIGVHLEQIGPGAVGVQGFPTFLFERRVEPGEFVAELLERFDDEGFAPNDEQTLHEVLDMMACKAAIKAGDHMSEPELRDLLRMREAVERSSNCPHGRPTSIRLTIRELEKRFGRS